MRISYVSDLHMEMGIKGVDLPGGNILLLAGDLIQVNSITEYAYGDVFHKFFKEQASKYDKVFTVLGNHEHYDGSITTSLDIMRASLSGYKNVQVLENNVVQLDKDWFLFGATLWTNYCDKSVIFNRAKDSARMQMNDHRVIRYQQGRFQPEDAFNINQYSRTALEDALYDGPMNANWIVMTHHTPSMKSGDEKWGGDSNMLNYAFHNTDLDNWIEKHSRLKFWIHGHTHDSMDYLLGGCRVLCNPKGYGRENREFDPTKQFEV